MEPGVDKRFNPERNPDGVRAVLDSQVAFRLDVRTLDALDRWIEQQPVPPKRAQICRIAIEEFVARHPVVIPHEGKIS